MVLDYTRVGELPPAVPNKLDIIPIHTSDRGSYKRCRRYWEWTSPSRMNLRPKRSIHGVSFPLWFGTGIHYALENYYNPALSRDPVESFITWFTTQYEGGRVEPEHWQLVDGLNAKLVKGKLVADGLRDLLPDPDPDGFAELRELGEGMMTFYKSYAAKHDNFTVIAVESDFSIPLGFEAADWRDGGRVKPVHLRGRRDAIIQDNDTGRFGILDHKTAAKADGENYARKLEQDEQCTSYLVAARMEAEAHNMEYKDIDFVLYNTLWKIFPKAPEIAYFGTKKFPEGRPSSDRNKPTTAALWYQAIKERNLDWWIQTDDKAQAYGQYLLDEGDSLFVRRDITYRNTHELQSGLDRIRMEAREMIDPTLPIYPNPSSDFRCLNCSLRGPCLGKDDGSDYESMLNDNYERQTDR